MKSLGAGNLSTAARFSKENRPEKYSTGGDPVSSEQLNLLPVPGQLIV